MAPTLGNNGIRKPSAAPPWARTIASAPRRIKPRRSGLLFVDVADDVLDVVVLVFFGEEGIVLFLLDFLFVVAALDLDGAAGGGLVVGFLERDGLDRVLDLDLGLGLRERPSPVRRAPARERRLPRIWSRSAGK